MNILPPPDPLTLLPLIRAVSNGQIASTVSRHQHSTPGAVSTIVVDRTPTDVDNGWRTTPAASPTHRRRYPLNSLLMIDTVALGSGDPTAINSSPHVTSDCSSH